MFKKNKKNFISIFVVDDAFLVRKSIYEYLFKKPKDDLYDIDFDFIGEASLKREFKDQLLCQGADLYFLDMDLPDGTAWDLIEEIYRRYPKAQIIAMTDENSIETQTLREKYEDQVVAVLEKPFQPNHVYEVYEQALRERFNIKHEKLKLAKPKAERTRIYFEDELKTTPTSQSFEENTLETLEWSIDSQAPTQQTTETTNPMTLDFHPSEFSLNRNEPPLEQSSLNLEPSSEFNLQIPISASEEPTLTFISETPPPIHSTTTPPPNPLLNFQLDEGETQSTNFNLDINLTTNPKEALNEESNELLKTGTNETFTIEPNLKVTNPSGEPEDEDEDDDAFSWGHFLSQERYPNSIFPTTPLQSTEPTDQSSVSIVENNPKAQTPSIASFILEEVYDDDEFESSPVKTPSTVTLPPVITTPSEDEPIKNEENISFDTSLSETSPFSDENNPQLSEIKGLFIKNSDEEDFFLLNEEKNLHKTQTEGNINLNLPIEDEIIIFGEDETSPSFSLIGQGAGQTPTTQPVTEDPLNQTAFNLFNDPVQPTSQPVINNLSDSFNLESTNPTKDLILDMKWEMSSLQTSVKNSEGDSFSLDFTEAPNAQFEYLQTSNSYTEKPTSQTNTFVFSEDTLGFQPKAPMNPVIPSEPNTKSHQTPQPSVQSYQKPTLGEGFVISPPRSKGPGVPTNPKEFGRFGIRK